MTPRHAAAFAIAAAALRMLDSREPAILALHEQMTRETNPRVVDSLSEAIRRIAS